MLYRWDKNYIQYSVNSEHLTDGSHYTIGTYRYPIWYYGTSSGYEINTSGQFVLLNATWNRIPNSGPGSDIEWIPLENNTIIVYGKQSGEVIGSFVYRVGKLYGNVPVVASTGYNGDYTLGFDRIDGLQKLTTQITGAGEFIEYVYSSHQDTYPNNSGQGGYWYKLERRNKS